MLASPIAAWICGALQKAFSLSDTQTIMYGGRALCIFINYCAGIVFYYCAKRMISIPLVAMVGTSAYLFGWSRVGVLMHSGGLQRGLSHAFLPLCFYLLSTWWTHSLSRKQQIVLGMALAGCLLSHPATFVIFSCVFLLYSLVEMGWKLSEYLRDKERRNARDLGPSIAGRASNLFLPALLCFGMTAWFSFPFLAERHYFRDHGWSRIFGESSVPLAKILPISCLGELIDRKAWFSDFISDPAQGGSYLGSITGVNSGYFGVSVILLCLLSVFLKRWEHKSWSLYGKILLTALMMFFIIFWEGGRYRLFHSLTAQLAWACRWMEIFYFFVCVLALFGALVVWEFCRTKWRNNRGISYLSMGCVIALVLYDFIGLVYLSEVSKFYFPHRGKKDALAIAPIIAATFDSYDRIMAHPAKGRVMDLPPLILHCNRIYHRRQNADGFDDGKRQEFLSYLQMLQREVPRAANFSFEYGNHHPVYSLKREHFRMHRDDFAWEEGKLRFRTRPGIENTEFSLEFLPVSGDYNACIFFPVSLPRGGSIRVTREGEDVVRLEASREGEELLRLPFQRRRPETSSLIFGFRLFIPSGSQEISIGSFEEPFVAYEGKSLAYRLALLDIRFLVFNLRYYQPTADRFPSSPDIRWVYGSRNSMFYENMESRDGFFPQKSCLLKMREGWKFFNDEISHYPGYDPNRAGFCYEGEEKDFDEVIHSPEKCRETIFSVFGPKQGTEQSPPGAASVTRLSMERIVWNVKMEKESFFFPSLAYHPNLKAHIDKTRSVRIHLAQAGMMAMKLPQGEYTLTIHYHHPWYDRVGKIVSWLTLASLLIASLLIFARARFAITPRGPHSR